jgi:hypothetical protein
MTVRRRILLAALSLVVIATLIVMVWASGDERPRPKLSFVSFISTNGINRVLNVRITNDDSCSIRLLAERCQFEGATEPRNPAYGLENRLLGRGQSFTNWFFLPTTGPGSHEGRRLRDQWIVQREMWFTKLRPRLQKLPVVGRKIKQADREEVMSEWLGPL